MTLLSICIPTYNRATHLANCLNSLHAAIKKSPVNIEVCISDNASTDSTFAVVHSFSTKLNIKYTRNEVNIGMTRNFINVISLSTSKYVWMIGDDDLLLPDTFSVLIPLLLNNKSVDFFYINAYHLSVDHINKYPHPFDLKYLPAKMSRFSNYSSNTLLPFKSLIDPSISFDFLGGIFLGVYNREKWLFSSRILDANAIQSNLQFSHFDNTFPHLRIYAHAFSSSLAFFYSSPLIICVNGIREWSSYNPLVMSVRLPQALDIYRKYGLSSLQYFRCLNFAHRNFAADYINLVRFKHIYSFDIGLLRVFLRALLLPYTYLSPFFYLFSKFKRYMSRPLRKA